MIDIAQVKTWSKEDIFEEMQKEYDASMQHQQNLLLLSRMYISGGMITRDEAAKLMRCSSSNIPSDVPRYKVGRKYVLFDTEEVMQYIKSHRIN